MKNNMKRYQVELYDYTNGATSPIDNIEAPAGYTADDYVRDCIATADQDWIDMLLAGEVSLIEIED